MSDVPTDQKNEAFDEPSRDEIPGISRQHTAWLETTDEESAWVIAGMDHVILHTIGRKSGNEHKVTLPFWFDPEGRRVVVGSYAGAPSHPAWCLNLMDRDANPKVKIRVRGGFYECDAEILEGEERARIWPLLIADRDHYRDYQTRTDRELPLIRFDNLVAIDD